MTNASWSHQTEIRVRGYELDSYRHVNHAVYLSYLEHARWVFLAENGLSLTKLDEMKRWPVVVRAEVDYKKPAFIDDLLVIHTRIPRFGKSSFDIEHEITSKGILIARAVITAAIIDETGRATRVPDEFRRLTPES
ncbi:acyl-CoA thioesterase [bacterium]|nr:acyl-CoA thioesterase [bacterium]